MPSQLAPEIVDAIAHLDSMSDKVAGFAIAQNFLWIAASFKSEVRNWLLQKRWYFILGAVISIPFYIVGETALYDQQAKLLGDAQYGKNAGVIAENFRLLFYIRSTGIWASFLLTALAFWGVTRPRDFPTVSAHSKDAAD